MSCSIFPRDVSLADGDGKVFMRHVRRALLPAVEILSGRSQCGAGLNGASTNILSYDDWAGVLASMCEEAVCCSGIH